MNTRQRHQFRNGSSVYVQNIAGKLLLPQVFTALVNTATDGLLHEQKDPGHIKHLCSAIAT